MTFQLLLLISLGRLINPSPNNLNFTVLQCSTVWSIVYKWIAFNMVNNLPRSDCTCKVQCLDCLMLRDTNKNPLCDLQTSVITLNVFVHNRLIRIRLKRIWSMTVSICKTASEQTTKSHWTDETKWKCLVIIHSNQTQRIIPHPCSAWWWSEGGGMIWACLASTGPGKHWDKDKFHTTQNNSETNLRLFLQQPWLGKSSVNSSVMPW